jgi:hypothetical protein
MSRGKQKYNPTSDTNGIFNGLEIVSPFFWHGNDKITNSKNRRGKKKEESERIKKKTAFRVAHATSINSAVQR